MTEAIVVELAGEPVAKGRPRSALVRGRDGRSFITNYTPAATRQYENALRIAAQDVMAGRDPLDGPLAVTITASFPVPASWSQKRHREALAGLIRPTGRPDWENVAKTIDALNKVVWRDDSLIVEAHVAKVYAARPGFRVEVRPVAFPPLPLAGLIRREEPQAGFMLTEPA